METENTETGIRAHVVPEETMEESENDESPVVPEETMEESENDESPVVPKETMEDEESENDKEGVAASANKDKATEGDDSIVTQDDFEAFHAMQMMEFRTSEPDLEDSDSEENICFAFDTANTDNTEVEEYDKEMQSTSSADCNESQNDVKACCKEMSNTASEDCNDSENEKVSDQTTSNTKSEKEKITQPLELETDSESSDTTDTDDEVAETLRNGFTVKMSNTPNTNEDSTSFLLLNSLLSGDDKNKKNEDITPQQVNSLPPNTVLKVETRPFISVIPESRLKEMSSATAEKKKKAIIQSLSKSSMYTVRRVMLPGGQHLRTSTYSLDQLRNLPYPPLVETADRMICRYCKEKCPTNVAYDTHFIRKSVKIEYNCRDCNSDFIFYNHCQLFDHIYRHPDSGGKIKSASDVKMSPVEPEMNILTTTNYDSGRKRCPECGKPVTNDNMHFFDSIKISDIKKHQCKICQLCLPTDCSLKAHVRLHTKSLPYVCPECGHQTCSFLHLHNHLKHSCLHYMRGIEVTCFKCQSVFMSLELLKSHMILNHTTNIFRCDKCSCFFYDVLRASKHVTYMHQLEPNAKIQTFVKCNFCTDVAVSENIIKSHFHTHALRCPATYVYRCNMCKHISFYDRESFSTHKENCIFSKHIFKSVSKSLKNNKQLLPAVSLSSGTVSNKLLNSTVANVVSDSGKSDSLPLVLKSTKNNISGEMESLVDSSQNINSEKERKENPRKSGIFIVEKYPDKSASANKNMTNFSIVNVNNINDGNKKVSILSQAQKNNISKMINCVMCKKILFVPPTLHGLNVAFRCSDCTQKVNATKRKLSAEGDEIGPSVKKYPVLGQHLMQASNYKKILPKPQNPLFRCKLCNVVMKMEESEVRQHFSLKHKDIKIISMGLKDQKFQIHIIRVTPTVDNGVMKNLRPGLQTAGATSKIFPLKKEYLKTSVNLGPSCISKSSTARSSTAVKKSSDAGENSDSSDDDCVVVSVQDADYVPTVEISDSEDDLSEGESIELYRGYKKTKSKNTKIEKAAHSSESRSLTDSDDSNNDDSETDSDDFIVETADNNDILQIKNLQKTSCGQKKTSRSRKSKKKTKDTEENQRSPKGMFSDIKYFDYDKEYVRHCFKCSFESLDKKEFIDHITTHRLYPGYQCLECGVSYLGKQGFRIHIDIDHGVRDVDEYIRRNEDCVVESHDEGNPDYVSDTEEYWECFKLLNVSSSKKGEGFQSNSSNSQISNNDSNIMDDNDDDDPLANSSNPDENMKYYCRICKNNFTDEIEFNTHIRTHGIAYLKNMLKSNKNQ